MARKRRKRRLVQDPLRALSQAELNRQADQLTQAALRPQRQSIARQQAEARRQAMEDEQTYRLASQALADQLHGVGQDVSNIYGGAASRQSAIAQGYAAGQRAAEQQSADQANQLLARQGQTADIGVGHGADAIYAGGGASPANFLNETGAAFGAAASMLPGAALGRGQQQISARIAAGQQEQDKFRQQLADLMERAPGIRADILKGLYGTELQKEAARVQREYLGVAQQKAATDAFAAQADAQNDAAKLAADQAETAAKNAGKNREARVAAFADARENAFAQAMKLFEGKEIDNPKALTDPRAPEKIVKRPNYQRAYAILYQTYARPLMRYAPAGGRGWWKRQLDVMIRNALKTAGYSRPGRKSRQRNTGGFGGSVRADANR